MSDENKVIEVEEKAKKFEIGQDFKNFLIVTFGSFVGLFAAMSLFWFLHKPPVPCHFPPKAPPCACCQFHHKHHMKHKHHPDFKGNFKGEGHFEHGKKPIHNYPQKPNFKKGN